MPVPLCDANWRIYKHPHYLVPTAHAKDIPPLTPLPAMIDLQGIFGVPLHQSIRYANVAISLFNDEGQSYIYGYVPIVVAKCGVFLKEKGEDTVAQNNT